MFARPLLRLAARAVDFVYPPTCQVCGEDTCATDDRFLSPSSILCRRCRPGPARLHPSFAAEFRRFTAGLPRGTAPALCSCCGEPAAVAAPDNSRCLACIVGPMNADSVFSLWRYEGEIEDVIKCYKYANRIAIGRLLGEWLGGELALRLPPRVIRPDIATAICGPAALRRCDLVASIPSSPQMLRKRGFSHLVPLAKAVASAVGLRYFPGALAACRVRPAQANLPALERRKNTSGAFRARARHVRDARILLVDDVVTSGASIDEAARVLKASGARSVDVVTLARSNNFSRNRIAIALAHRRANACGFFRA